MSLIDEALKRARQEAARQDAAQRYAYPATPAQVPARDRSRKALLTGLAAGLLIGVLAIGGTLWVTRSRSGDEVAAAPSPAADTAAPLPVTIEELQPGATSTTAAPPVPPTELPALAAPTPAPVPVPTPAPPARVEVPATEVQPRPAAPAPAERPVAPPLPATPPVEPQTPPPAAAEPPTAIAAPPPPPLVVPAPDPEAPGTVPAPTHTAPPETPPAQPGSGLDGRTFVRELQVPGGGRLELRGIASGSQPAALINGRVVGQGEVIEGFTVVGVEPRRVRLRGYGATVFLSLDPEQ